MPVVSITEIAPDTLLGLWKIDESIEVFFEQNSSLSYLKDKISNIKSQQRRCEILAVNSLLCRMLGADVRLHHEDSGKPYLSNGFNIGISHTKGCAAVIVSRTFKVSVDVEYVSKRVERVADKMLRDDEKADSIFEKIIHWCTKETLYKLYSEEHLSLKDMRLSSINGDENRGTITACNIKRDETLNVNYVSFDGFVLTYTAIQ